MAASAKERREIIPRGSNKSCQIFISRQLFNTRLGFCTTHDPVERRLVIDIGRPESEVRRLRSASEFTKKQRTPHRRSRLDDEPGFERTDAGARGRDSAS